MCKDYWTYSTFALPFLLAKSLAEGVYAALPLSL